MNQKLKPYRVALTLKIGNSKGIEASGILLALSDEDAQDTLNQELQKARSKTSQPLTNPVGFASQAPRETRAEKTLRWDTLLLKQPDGDTINISDRLGQGAPTEAFAHLLDQTAEEN